MRRFKPERIFHIRINHKDNIESIGAFSFCDLPKTGQEVILPEPWNPNIVYEVIHVELNQVWLRMKYGLTNRAAF